MRDEEYVNNLLKTEETQRFIMINKRFKKITIAIVIMYIIILALIIFSFAIRI